MLASCVAIHRLDARLQALGKRRANTSSSSSSTSDSSGDGGGSGGYDSCVGGGASGEGADASPPSRLRPSLSSLRDFSTSYWLYLFGSACAYGSIVPFWFIGAKAIALRWNMSLAQVCARAAMTPCPLSPSPPDSRPPPCRPPSMRCLQADTFLLWPEGAIGLIAPPFGMLIDRQRWSLRTRLRVAAWALALIPIGHVALALLPLPPILGVGLLGIGYAIVQNLVWASIALVSPPALLNLSAGLIGCAVNVLPSLLPAASLSGDVTADLLTLAATGMVGVLAFGASACYVPVSLPSTSTAHSGAELEAAATVASPS